MLRVLILICLLIGSPGWAQTPEILDPLEVSDTAEGVQVFASYTAAATVVVDPGTEGCVWLVEITGDCATVVTGPAGKRICNESGSAYPVGWEYLAGEGWNRQICAILDATAPGAVNLIRSRR